MTSQELVLGLDGLQWTVAQTVVAGVALLGLIVYCVETFRLRRAAERQIETMTKPVIMVSDEDFPKVRLENLGNGAAFNVRYKFAESINRATPRLIPALPVGKSYEMGDLFYHIGHEQKLSVSYESASGMAYMTEGHWERDEAGVTKGPVRLVIHELGHRRTK